MRFFLNKFTKRVIFILIIMVILSVGSVFIFEKIQKKETSKNERPNLILISVDSLRADHVSSYGYPRETTPNIDNLAKEGVLFKNYITNAYLTPISEMCLHTGMYPISSGVVGFDTILPKKYLTLAQILKIYNYRTAAFGNSPEFLLFSPLKTSFEKGFDIYNFEEERSGVKILRERQQFIDKKQIFDFLKEKDSPFFVWLALGSVHFPYNKFSRQFGDLTYSGPLKDYFLEWGNGDILPFIFNNIFYQFNGKKNINETNISNEDIQYIIDRYDDGILKTDEWIGDFLTELKNTGLDKNTVIILASEHGEAFNEQGYIHHYDVFDNTIKTPLIIKSSILKKQDAIIENQVQSIDILPTILEFLNILISHQIEGNSLVSLINGQSLDNFNEYIFSERVPLWERVMFQAYFLKDEKLGGRLEGVINYFNKTTEKLIDFYPEEVIKQIKDDQFLLQGDFAVRTKEWKLIYRKTKDFQEKYSWWRVLSKSGEEIYDYELYNLKTDPNEKENVIDKYPDIVKELKEKLDIFIKQQENKRIVPQIENTIQEYF